MLEGQALWPEIDAALVVGTRFVATALAWGREKEVKVVRIDIDPAQAVLPRPADVVITTGAKSALPALLAALQKTNSTRPSRQTTLDAAKRSVLEKLGGLEPQRSFARVLREELPDEAIVVTDVTQMGYFIQHGMPFYQPRTCITSGYQATLGFAMPTAFGAQVAFPERKVVAICGDGGFMFNVQEMSTAVAHNIPVVTIVFDDGAFGNVKKIQKESYGARHIGVDLTNPDFVTLAKSFGMLGIKAETPDALRAALREAFAARGPALIHVPVGELPDIWKLVQRPPSQGPKPN
jgi:acetolactate synthase-1/2/3 large subunit